MYAKKQNVCKQTLETLINKGFSTCKQFANKFKNIKFDKNKLMMQNCNQLEEIDYEKDNC